LCPAEEPLADDGELGIKTSQLAIWRLFFMGTVKLIFGFAIFAALILGGIKIVPPFFANYELEDAMKTEATQSTYSVRTEDDIRESIIKQARGYDIALTPKQVHVVRTGNYGTGTLTIDAEYSVPVDLPGYSTALQFHPASTNKGVF
jgi:hypothetical protein